MIILDQHCTPFCCHSLLAKLECLLQLKTALQSFDTNQKPADNQKVHCNSSEIDEQLFHRIFVADMVEHSLGVNLSALDSPAPAAAPANNPSALQSAPEPAPKDSTQASHIMLGIYLALISK